MSDELSDREEQLATELQKAVVSAAQDGVEGLSIRTALDSLEMVVREQEILANELDESLAERLTEVSDYE